MLVAIPGTNRVIHAEDVLEILDRREPLYGGRQYCIVVLRNKQTIESESDTEEVIAAINNALVMLPRDKEA